MCVFLDHMSAHESSANGISSNTSEYAKSGSVVIINHVKPYAVCQVGVNVYSIKIGNCLFYNILTSSYC